MKCVIIGAGQTGRGFIAPFLIDNHAELTFIDKNDKLIRQLNERGSYTVHYFDRNDTKVITGFKAYTNEDIAAVNALKEADLIMTSVFASNVQDLIPILRKAELNETPIICIENGVDVKRPLVDSKISSVISEGIIFCTSIGHDNLDVTSEYGIQLPVDQKSLKEDLNIEGILMEKSFADLIARKIYTYNFISAIIAYFGSYSAYKSYGEAANDEVIQKFILKTLDNLNPLIARKTNIDLRQQLAFSHQAIRKFENRAISDSILRNAQQADRKLGANERLMSPLRFAIERGHELKPYLWVIASAIHYGRCFEGMDAQQKIEEVQNRFPEADLKQDLSMMVDGFEKYQPLGKLLEDFI